MDIVKIGKFIAENRKKKNLTQAQLAEKLGVTSKTISRWENGNYMPDISLLKPISEELDITLNDLLSGEKVEKEKYQEKLEENMLMTIDYSTKKVYEKNNAISILLIVFGIVIAFFSMTTFPSESSWGSIGSVFGGMISVVGVGKLTKKYGYLKRLLSIIGYFLVFVLMLFVIDYVGVVYQKQAPRFSYVKSWYSNNIIEYKSPLCNVYRINTDTPNEYYIVDSNKTYTVDTIPVSPFNREKAGIDNIIKYKNEYVGNNSNDGNLISSLPLSEYGYVFEIDSTNLVLTIDYQVTDWYINNNHYLEKSLLYNSVSLFSLIDNVQSVKFNFSGKTYGVTRSKIEELYPNYKGVVTNGTLYKDNFNKYVEEKMNDDEFVLEIFTKIFE